MENSALPTPKILFDPLQVGLARRLHLQHQELRRLIAVQRKQPRFERLQLACIRLQQQHGLARSLNLPLPVVDRRHTGQQRRARRQPLLHQDAPQPPRLFSIGRSRQNQSHRRTSFHHLFPSPSLRAPLATRPLPASQSEERPSFLVASPQSLSLCPAATCRAEPTNAVWTLRPASAKPSNSR